MKTYKLILKPVCIVLVFLAAGIVTAAGSGNTNFSKMIFVRGGYYRPLFKEVNSSNEEFVKSFYIDSNPVTNREYLAFVKANPEWRKSKIKNLFADKNYLRSWENDLEPGNIISDNEPVTNISWFAANAYCKWVGKRLPTVDEWEYYLNKTGKNTNIHSGRALHEWTFDFNETDIQAGSVCGGAGASSNDPTNYNAFLRFGFRNSLKANYSLDDLGLRCVASTGKNELVDSSQGKIKNIGMRRL
jgi:sulfatase modifying factor 1